MLPGPVEVGPARIAPGPLALAESHHVPDRYEPNYAYPLLVAFHNRGADEHRGAALVPAISARNYAGLSLRGPEPVLRPGRPAGFAWGPDFREAGRPGPADPGPVPPTWDDHPIDRLEDAVFEAVRRTRRTMHVHSERVYLIGMGEGGAVALRLGLAHPDRFAGAVSIDGWFPEGCRPLGRYRDCRGFRVFLARPEWGSPARQRRNQRVARALYAAGVDVSFRTYPVIRPLVTQLRRDLDAWLLGPIAAGAMPVDEA